MLVLLVMASVTIVTVDFRTRGEGPLDAVGRSVMTVVGPIQEGLVRIFRPVGNFLAGFTEVPSLRARVGELERQNAALRAERQQVSDVARENASLRKLLALPERLGLDTFPARVIGVSPSNFERTVFIDRGSGDGVRKDMPVVSGDGLVGRVISVSASVAQVLLVVDRSSAVAARVASNGETGVVEGTAGRGLRLELFDPEAEIAVGDSVVTSGYDRGLYPPGIPIGTVTETPLAGGRPSRVVPVEPLIDFSRLDYVLLVTGEAEGKR